MHVLKLESTVFYKNVLHVLEVNVTLLILVSHAWEKYIKLHQ